MKMTSTFYLPVCVSQHNFCVPGKSCIYAKNMQNIRNMPNIRDKSYVSRIVRCQNKFLSFFLSNFIFLETIFTLVIVNQFSFNFKSVAQNCNTFRRNILRTTARSMFNFYFKQYYKSQLLGYFLLHVPGLRLVSFPRFLSRILLQIKVTIARWEYL